MFLSGRMLKNVQNVNSWQVATAVLLREGSSTSVYFQLTDDEQASDLTNGQGLRYMPAAGSTVTITISSINSTNVITRNATQPFPLDASIWQFNILSTDKISQGNLMFSLTENGIVKTGVISRAIAVQSLNPSLC